ncbi:fatty acyl-CoA reductase wat-like isoform X1 [Bacillus rossius redtenbacheri]|uniref:fatty acyl-CoA reductase wat-like isoform X1 n=1 Tax=Bacillus rossius redtenbacheri TaxID=93214 RepID=UPI002FDD1634
MMYMGESTTSLGYNLTSPGDNSPVQDFYRDCGVLVTGGTGFLGKLVIEKILRCCPAARTVYVLIRPKKGVSAEDRREALMDNEVFERMKSEQPDWQSRLVFVSGDCSQPRLGLSDTDYHHLTQHVNIVLHLAATVRFDETLKVAIAINVKGTEDIIRLCRDCVRLKAAVFVSTAYSNCIHQLIKEEFYEPPMSLDDLFALMDSFTEQELHMLLPKVKCRWPNTYAFSKAMAENLILTQAKDLPVSVVRPSMVVNTYYEPVRGWVDNMYGPIAIGAGMGTGLMHVCYAAEEAVMDIIPADMVTNCILVAASQTGYRKNYTIPIYNITTPENNSLTVKSLADIWMYMLDHFPLKMCICYPFCFHIKNYRLYMLLTFFLHFIPGCVVDCGLRLKGMPPMLTRLYRKIQKYSILTGYFATKTWKFMNGNSIELYTKLEARDKEIFYFDTGVIDWKQYMFDGTLGIRKYLLHEPLDNLQEAKFRLRLFTIAQRVLKVIFYGVVLWTGWHLIKIPGIFKREYLKLIQQL